MTKKEYNKLYYKNNRNRILKNKQNYNKTILRIRSKEYLSSLSYEEKREKKLLYLYDISLNEYNNMVIEQNGLCYICKEKPEILYVDHNHSTNTVRKLLCQFCNSGISYFKENINYLYNSINYLNSDAMNIHQLDWNMDKQLIKNSLKLYWGNKIEYQKQYKLLNRYGITLQQFSELIVNHKLCFICKQDKKVCIDHDHNTKKIRGLLCHDCNVGLGHLNHNQEIINNCIAYLKGTVNNV